MSLPDAHEFLSVETTSDGYRGKFVAYPQKKDEWKYMHVYVSKLPDGTIQGSTLNDYCDGNWRGLENSRAIYYYTQWSESSLKESPS